MGRVITEKKQVRFEINNKQDCIMYLGHIIEYLKKKEIIYKNLNLKSINYLLYELNENQGIHVKGIKDILNISEEKDINIDFYEFKLYNSSINLIKNEIINLIGDFSADKRSISYNNYLDIVKHKKIQGVKFKTNIDKKKLVDWFNLNRNYLYHFSSDKLCEWIEYREQQIKKYEGAKFEFDKEFNIYMSETISLKLFVEEISKNIAFINKINEITKFIKKDFEELIGEEVSINIKQRKFDNSIKDITYNGFISHKASKRRYSK